MRQTFNGAMHCVSCVQLSTARSAARLASRFKRQKRHVSRVMISIDQHFVFIARNSHKDFYHVIQKIRSPQTTYFSRSECILLAESRKNFPGASPPDPRLMDTSLRSIYRRKPYPNQMGSKRRFMCVLQPVSTDASVVYQRLNIFIIYFDMIKT